MQHGNISSTRNDLRVRQPLLYLHCNRRSGYLIGGFCVTLVFMPNCSGMRPLGIRVNCTERAWVTCASKFALYCGGNTIGGTARGKHYSWSTMARREVGTPQSRVYSILAEWIGLIGHFGHFGHFGHTLLVLDQPLHSTTPNKPRWKGKIHQAPCCLSKRCQLSEPEPLYYF